MAEIFHPKKALAVNPLKASQPIGASLAFLGLAEAMPLEHGARGCTSFNKLFFMRHFREPIALQTTAMEQVSTIMGADGSVVEALKTICERNAPRVIGLLTTGLSELQGADIERTIQMFRQTCPEFASVKIIPVSASDTLGCLESGFALAVKSLIATLVPERRPVAGMSAGRRTVNVLASSMLTPGDVDELKDWVSAFGLHPIVLPDVSESLDGHLLEPQRGRDDVLEHRARAYGYSTLTYGGTTLDDVAEMGKSVATLVVGDSLNAAADLLKEKTGVPDYRFADLTGLASCDAFCQCLSELSQRPIPPRFRRQRSQLQDAMVDCQFQFGGARVGIAADSDILAMYSRFFIGMGADVVAAVASTHTDALEKLPVETVVVGDLQDFEWLSRENQADLVVTNAHGLDLSRRCGAAFLRAGFPLYDLYGAQAKVTLGYRGTRDLVFEVANLLSRHYEEIPPYRSLYWHGTPRADENPEKGSRAASLVSFRRFQEP